MTIDTILIEAGPGETRVALMEGDRLRELAVERDGEAGLVGNVYLGRVERVLPGIAAAFVDIGLPRAGFLGLAEARPPDAGKSGGPPADRIGDYVGEGDAVLVQVQREPTADKGAKLTTHIGLTGRALVLLPGADGIMLSRRIAGEAERARLQALLGGLAEPGEGLILRTAGAGVDEAFLRGEAEVLHRRWRELEARRAAARPPACLLAEPGAARRALRDAGPGVRRIVVDGARALTDLRDFCREQAPDLEACLIAHDEPAPLFEARGVEDAIEAALAPRVPLPSGGSLIIEPTAALTTIDVNTGGRAEGGGFEDIALAANLEAADEIARQMRLRNLSGILIVDFVPMKRRSGQAEVLARLRAAAADDPVPAHIFGFTGLGLVEMTRPRHGETLAERLGAPCPMCGTGRTPSPTTVACALLRRALAEGRRTPGASIEAEAAPAVVEALETTLTAARTETEERLGAPLRLGPDPALAGGGFRLAAVRRTGGRP